MTEFCPTCEEYRDVKAVERQEVHTLRGTEIAVLVKVNVCGTCGESFGSDEQDQQVVDAVHGEYRRLNDLLTPERIKEIRRRYRLSQRSFAALLGMSEATVNRYEKGGLQDQVHDNAIRACEDPAYVRNVLQRRGHLLTDWQKKRAEEALAGTVQPESGWIDLLDVPGWPDVANEASDRTGFRRFDYKRFASVVVWFCRRMGPVSRTIVNKLLFYADFLNFKTSTVSLTGTAYRRLTYGPVPSDYGQLLGRMEAECFLECSEVEFPNGNTGYYYTAGPKADTLDVEFTGHEQKVLSRVAEALESRTAKDMSDRSHREPAWQNTEEKKLISYQEAATLSLDLADES